MKKFKCILIPKLFLIKKILFLTFVSSLVYGQEVTYEGVKSKGYHNAKHGFISDYDDGTFGNWLGSGEPATAYPLIGTNNQHGGFGMVEGSNIISPMVWMYEYSGRNAFMVNRAPFSANGTNRMIASVNLFAVRESGKVGIGTAFPSTLLELKQKGADGLSLSRESHDTYELFVGGTKGLYIKNRTDGHRVEMMFDGNGRIGIGTDSPGEKLEIISSDDNGGIGIRNANEPISDWGLKISQRDNLDGLIAMAGQNLQIYSGWNRQLILGHSEYDNPDNLGKGKVVIPWGKVGIGTTDTSNGNYKLYVKNGIRTEKVKVDVSSNWADFVFEEDYQLRSLEEVESFVKENKHLPEIPSASEVEEEGIDLGTMDAKLLQKIEELTLYMIEQDKRMKALEKQNEKISEENKKLKDLILSK